MAFSILRGFTGPVGEVVWECRVFLCHKAELHAGCCGTGVSEDDAEVPSPVGTHHWKWPGGHKPCGPWHSELTGAAAGMKPPSLFWS